MLDMHGRFKIDNTAVAQDAEELMELKRAAMKNV
jgi:hypothetical protein